MTWLKVFAAVVSAALLLFGLFLMFHPGPFDGLEFLSAPIDPYQGWPG